MSDKNSCSELWNLYGRILGSTALTSALPTVGGQSSIALEQLLSKSPDLLERFHQTLVATQDDEPDLASAKPRFVCWLIRCLLFNWNRHYDPRFASIISKCTSVQTVVLKILDFRDQLFCGFIISKYIKFLSDLLTAAGNLNESNEAVSVCRFAELIEDDDLFNSNNTDLKFEDHDKLEFLQVRVTELLCLTSEFVVKYSKSEIQKVWSLISSQLELGNLPLKLQSIRLASNLLRLKSVPKDIQTFDLFLRTLVALISFLINTTFPTGDLDFVSQFREPIFDCVDCVKNGRFGAIEEELFCARFAKLWNSILTDKYTDTDFLLCDHDYLWTTLKFIIFKHELRSVDSGVLVEFVLKKVTSLDPNISEVVAEIVQRQILESVEWQTKRKQSCGPRPTPDAVFSSCLAASLSSFWQRYTEVVQSLPSPTDTIACLVEMTGVAKKVMLALQKTSSFKFEIDFFGKDLIEDIVEKLVHHCISKSSFDFVEVLDNLFMVQPRDTLTSIILHQFIAMISLPWMNGEMKLADLRIGETLSFNLTKASERFLLLSGDRSMCIRLICTLGKEVAPKWRMWVLRKAMADGGKTAQAVIDNLARFLHHFGPIGHPLAAEVMAQAIDSQSDDLVSALAENSGRIVCALGNKTSSELVDGSFDIFCQHCSSTRPNFQDKSPSQNPSVVDIKEVNVLLKVVGHSDRNVSLKILALLKPLSIHVGITPETAGIWLNYLNSENEDLAIRFSRHIQYLVRPGPDKSYLPLVLESLISSLKEAVDIAAGESSPTYKEAVCRALVSLAMSKCAQIEEEIFSLLLELLLTPSCHISVFCAAQNILREQMSNYKTIVNSKLAEKMCTNDPKETLDSLMSLYKNGNAKRFLSQQAHHLLPRLLLLSVRNDKSKSPLSFIASVLNQKTKTILAANFYFIYPYIVLHSKNSLEYKKCCRFFERESKLEISQVLLSHRQKVVAELMLQFHSHKNRVVKALETLAMNDEEFSKKHPKQKGSSIAAFILPRFLGILGYFDQLLINSYVNIDKKREILRSLSDIIKFMGPKNVATVKHKIMSILNTTFQLKDKDDLEDLLLECWDSFVRTIDPTLIGPILAQIIASLMLIFDTSSVQVASIMKFIVIENRENFKCHFNRLNFVTEYSELKEINDVIREESNLKSDTDISVVLQLMAHSIAENDIIEVKSQTLSKMVEVLRCNQGNLQILITQNDQVDSVISNLIPLLLKCAREKDSYVSGMAAKCLGSIGAVDPGRLQLMTNLESSFDINMSIMNECFAHDLINDLVRAYLSTTDSNDADACAFSIQEVLKAYSITGADSANTLRGSVWLKLEDATKELLQPLLVSLYSKADRVVEYSIPIFMSKDGQNYHDWLANWSCHLISKVSDKDVGDVFIACKVTIRKDLRSAQFLIPYITIAALCGSEYESVCSEISSEFTAVLSMCASQESGKVSGSSSLEKIQGEKSGHGLQWLASQTLFSILDHMNKWLRKKYLSLTAMMRRTDDPEVLVGKDKEYTIVSNFVKSIPKISLARASFCCEGYARALMHYESHLRENTGDLEQYVTELQKVYGALEEPDFLSGLSSVRRTEMTLLDMIHQHTILANFQDALACYESLGRQSDGSMIECGLLNCYLQIDQPHTASILVKGLLDKRPEMADSLRKYQIEAAWQLGQWDELAEIEFSGNEDCWSHCLGAALNSVNKKNFSDLTKWLGHARLTQTLRIAAAAMEQGSYSRCYDNVVRLQILDEIETLSKLAFKSTNITTEALDTLFSQWRARVSFSLYSSTNQEQVLRIRRSLLSLILNLSSDIQISKSCRERIRFELGDCWLLSAKISRKTGQLNKSYKLLLESQKFGHKEAFIEKAKLLWLRENQSEAITVLSKGIEENFPGYERGFEKRRDLLKPLSAEDMMVCGKAKLLLAQYVDSSSLMEAEEVTTYYNEAKTLASSEDAFYSAATFFDKILGKNYDETDLDKRGDLIYHIISQYARSLLCGSKHLHQSLPRLLSLWLDYGSRAHQNEQKSGKNVSEMTKTLRKMNELMSKMVEKCPAYVFLTALPQLASRICHSHLDVWNILRNLIIKTFVKYPNHVFWHTVALSKSSYQTRVVRCKEIIDHVRSRNPSLAKLIDSGLKLGDMLVSLSDEKAPCGTTVLRQVSPGLLNLVRSGELSKLMIPTTQNMSMMMPAAESQHSEKHNPFPSGLVCIESMLDEVSVMRSLVMPKKVTFVGSDGRKYNFLCKPKDDLRRDCRLVDFNTLLNKLFIRDPESRKRDLHIRTYTVIPLNETTGIIEWINNLQALRPILMNLYKEKLGKNMMRPEEIRDKFQTSETDAARNLRNFEVLLSRHPPVFAEWFVQNFPDPQSWHMARLAYTRTTAVISMVGYLIGLGDRHGENILFDTLTGDTVHVDLNLLFNKGWELKIPEVVPFRLTQNMVQSMGPTGYEGPFRISCEVALGLMRKQKDILMSSLRPFIFDPLVDWVANGRHKKTGSGEIVNEKAVETLRAIENRLNGRIEQFSKKKTGPRSNMDIPLSGPGQVQHLIKEATSVENLAQMYMGWAPYL